MHLDSDLRTACQHLRCAFQGGVLKSFHVEFQHLREAVLLRQGVEGYKGDFGRWATLIVPKHHTSFAAVPENLDFSHRIPDCHRAHSHILQMIELDVLLQDRNVVRIGFKGDYKGVQGYNCNHKKTMVRANIKDQITGRQHLVANKRQLRGSAVAPAVPGMRYAVAYIEWKFIALYGFCHDVRMEL